MLQSAVAAVELKSGHKLDQLTFEILKSPHRISNICKMITYLVTNLTVQALT